MCPAGLWEDRLSGQFSGTEGLDTGAHLLGWEKGLLV